MQIYTPKTNNMQKAQKNTDSIDFFFISPWSYKKEKEAGSNNFQPLFYV